MDVIALRNFHTTAVIGPDAWKRPGKPQPVVLSLKLIIDTTAAGSSDEIAHTFSYGQMCKDVNVLSDGHFRNVDDFLDSLTRIVLAKNWPGENLHISLTAPKALLRVEGGLGVEITLRKQWLEDGASRQQMWVCERQAWLVKQLKVACIIGVNPHERLEKQQVVITLEIGGENRKDEGGFREQDAEGANPWASLVSRVCNVCLPFPLFVSFSPGYLLSSPGCRTF